VQWMEQAGHKAQVWFAAKSARFAAISAATNR
jgi:predicted ATPase